MTIQGIYKILNTHTKKFYIGSSKDIGHRWKQHLSNLNRNVHPNKHLQSAWNKYGAESFEFNIIEETINLTSSELLKIEQNYLDKYNKRNIYNVELIAGGGGASTLGFPCKLFDNFGNFINDFKSIMEVSRYIEFDRQLPKKNINSNTLTSGKYCIFTTKYYRKNLNKINDIFNYHKERYFRKHRDIIKRLLLVTEMDFNSYVVEFKNLKEVGEFLSVDRETVRLWLLKAPRGEYVITHKGYKIRFKYKPEDLKFYGVHLLI
jgi:hypothetical protein